MFRRRTLSRLLFALSGPTLAALSLSTPRDARASGFSAARFGSEQGSPALGNGFSVFYNPAAMTATVGTSLTSDGSLAVRTLSYTRPSSALSPSDPARSGDPTYRAANTGTSTAFNFIYVPYAGVVSDLGTQDFRMGVAAYAPFGGQVQWQKNLAFEGSTQAPGAVDGVTRWNSISGALVALYATAAAAYHIPGTRLSLGVSGSLVYNLSQTVRARNGDGSDDITNPDGSLKEGRALLDTSSWTPAVGGGIYWEVDEARKLRIGASYASQPGFGVTRFNGNATTQLGTDPTKAPKQAADFLQAWPDVVRVGVLAQVHPQWDIKTDFVFERWSVLQNQCVVKAGAPCSVNAQGGDPSGNVLLNIPRNFKDAVTLRSGPTYRPTPDTELFASVGFSTPAIPKKYLDGVAIDSFTLLGTFGASYSIGRWKIASSANLYQFLDVDTKGTSTFATLQGASRSPSADGVHQQTIFGLDGYLVYQF